MASIFRPVFRSRPTVARKGRGEGRALSSSLALGLTLAAALAAPAAARQPVNVSEPFEVGESPAGNYLAALVAGAERDTLAASTFFREALRATPKNPELAERAFIASLANGDMPEAFDLAERVLRFDPSNGLAHLSLGVRDFKAGRFQAARAQFVRSGAGSQRDLTATLLTAWSWLGSGKPAKALETIDAMRDDGLTIFRDYHGALIAALANKPDVAKRRFDAVYAADHSTLRIVDAYARFLSGQGDKAGARAAYEAFARLIPNHPTITAALDEIEAGKTLSPVVANARDGGAEVLYGLGAIGGRQGDELAAMIYLRLSAYLSDSNPLTQISLADIAERLKRYDQAIDAYEAIPAKSPLRTTADTQVGLLLEQMGKKDEATRHLNAVVSENPKNAEAWTALGNLQRVRKEFAEAIVSYTKALELSGGQPEKTLWTLYYFRGIAYERDRKWPLAEADFRKALALQPDQPLILNYLGYSWVDKGLNLEEAFKMLRRAVELRPQDGFIVDSLAWAHYKLGRFEEATRELERAIELKPSDPVINDHLGDAYWRVGRKLEAQFQWNHARDLKPEPEDLEKILDKIKSGLPDEPRPTTADAQKPAAPGADTGKDAGPDAGKAPAGAPENKSNGG